MTPVKIPTKELFFRLVKRTFHSNGKLLLTGEYVVLDGATALAIPTRYGQSLEVQVLEKKGIDWKSFDENGNIWFEGNFKVKHKQIVSQNASDLVGNQLLKILQEAKEMNPLFLKNETDFKVTTKLDFPRNWGLGTSSTLINNIAQWANVDSFALLGRSFGGSGYDIAAAQNDSPIFYQLKNKRPEYRKIHLSWNFIGSLFFVHLNKKQDSKKGIAHYKKQEVDKKIIQRISDISNKILMCYSLSDFEKLMNAHEEIISEIIKIPTIKEQFFSDYSGTIKSLGAWGGDFVLATGNSSDMDYFRKKGFETIIPFGEMIKN